MRLFLSMKALRQRYLKPFIVIDIRGVQEPVCRSGVRPES